MYFTEDDLERVVTWAIWRASRSLGIIADDEPFAPRDAVEMIAASKGHFEALREFANAYMAWYEFHLAIYKAGKSGNLSALETQQLNGLIDRRESAKKALIAITA